MPSNPHVAATIVALVATYALHSTLLLGGVWLAFAVTRSRSAVLQERLWKLAALAPLLTAPLQLLSAEHVGDRSLFNLPAITFANANDGDAQWEGEAPAEPRGAQRSLEHTTSPERSAVDAHLLAHNPYLVGDSTEPSLPQRSKPPARSIPALPVIESDDADLVEIIPGPDSSLATSPIDLPTIDPAPADSVEVTPADPDIHSVVITPRPRTFVSAADAIGIEPATPPRAWRPIAAAIFATLFTLGAARLLWRAFRTRCRLWRTETISAGPLREALDQLLAQRGVRRSVRLAQSATAVEPAAGGVFRWLIVVPPGISQKLSIAELQALLAHELAHLVRRDPLWLWIAAALCWCFPLQPLNFLAVRRWRQAAEELCDDWAITGGVRPLTLANCLTRVAEWRLAPMPLGLTSDVGQSRFARRISRLVEGTTGHDRWSRPARRRLIVAASSVCIVLLTFCGPRMQAGSPVAEPSREGEAPAEPQSTQDIASDSTPTPLRAAQGVANDTEPPNSATDPSITNNPVLNPDTQSEIHALLTDLERVESLIGQLGDDPDIAAARARIRERLESLRVRIPP
ncbi:MAG: M56 family metallopeptidase [Planctomycetaceae bacterium]